TPISTSWLWSATRNGRVAPILSCPPRREPVAGRPGDGRVVGDIVEQDEPCFGPGFHVKDAQAARAHVQAIAIAPQFDAQERTDDQSDGRFVRDDQNRTVLVVVDGPEECR